MTMSSRRIIFISFFSVFVLGNGNSVLADPPDITIEAIDVNVGPSHGNPSNPVVWNDQLYFVAKDGFACSGSPPGEVIGDELGEYGEEIFTAGIGTGPVLVADVNKNTSANCGGVSSTNFDQNSAGLPDALVFRGRDKGGQSGSTGFEPWRTQGTELTTKVIKNLWIGWNSRPYGMTTVLGGTHVAMGAATAYLGVEPWVTNGTSEGTVAVGNISVDDYDSDPYYFTPLDDDRFVFIATDDDIVGFELYVSDGSTSTLVANINADPYDDSDIQMLTTFEGQAKVVFYVNDETTGREPWVSDGTPGGTFLLKDINPGTGSSNTSDTGDNSGFVQVDDLMFFSADDGAHGHELWATDGTTDGTRMVKDVVSGPGGGYFAQAAAFKDQLFFAAPGVGLWSSDGTESGTKLLVSGFSNGLQELTAVGDLLYFRSSVNLWVSDATAAGTIQVASFPNRAPTALTAVGSHALAFWARTDEVGQEMFLAYETSLLPDTKGPLASANFSSSTYPIQAGVNGFLVGLASEINTGGQNILVIEYQLDGGDWWPMESLDDAYDSPVESSIESIDFATAGIHQACVRGKDALNNIGDPSCIEIEVTAPDETPPVAPTLNVTPNPALLDENITISIEASDVATGNSNILLIEYRLDGGNWISILTPVDGTMDEPVEVGEAVVSFDTDGLHEVCARATDAGANTGAENCLNVQVNAPDPTMILRAIEVNQVIQTWTNDVPLIREKATVVRVFLEKADSDSPNTARGMLHGSINGSPLPGSPLPADKNLFIDVVEDVTEIDDPGTPDDESWRANSKNSLNYTLPVSWTDKAGTVDLSFVISSPLHQVLGCEEPDGDSDCEVSVNFIEGANPRIQFFSVPYVQGSEFQIDITGATGGTYRLSSGDRTSDALAFDAGQDDVEEALEFVLDSNKKRLFVWSFFENTQHRVFTHSGKNESLSFDDTNLVGGSISITEVTVGGSTIAPTLAGHLREQVSRVSDAMPIRTIDFTLRTLNGYNDTPRAGTVNRRLETLRGMEWGFNQRGKYYGYLLGSMLEGGRSGMSWLNVSNTFARGSEAPTTGDSGRNVGVHEAAHMFGRGHAVVEAKGAGKVGICGSKYNFTIGNHPFVEVINGVENTSRTAGEDRWEFTWPTIGPLSSGPENEVWGFSPRAYRNGYDALTVIDPRNSTALMSYCNAPTNTGQDGWPSSYTYNKMINGLLAPASAVDSSMQVQFGTQDYIFVSGYIDTDTGLPVFEPVIYSTGADPGFEGGELQISLLDSDDTEITSATALLQGDGDHPALAYGPGLDEKSFVTAIPLPPGSSPVNTIVLSIANEEIGRLLASEHAPNITSLNIDASGASEGSMDITWDASDDDGDDLTSTLLLSTDGGLTWTVIAMGLEGSSYQAPTTALSGSDFAQIRLLVSDGMHQAESTSSPFVLDAGYPMAGIELPLPGTKVVAGASFTLRGDAWDPEDGLLSGGSLLWSVSSDDPLVSDTLLGLGAVVEVPASALPDGCQEITLTATDSNGKTDTDMVKVDIGATGCLGRVFEDSFE